MALDKTLALKLVKDRLNRLPGDTSLDDYLRMRVLAAVNEAQALGLDLDTCGVDGLLYVVDYTVWSYQNRDEGGGMPEWLRLRRRELFLRSGVSL